MPIQQILFQIITSFLDILSVTVVIYFALKLVIKSEKHMTVIVGIIICMLVYGLSSILSLHTLQKLMDNVFSWSVIIIVIIFQEEIKSYLESLGSINSIFKKQATGENTYLEDLVEVVYKMGEVKTGALITIKRSVNLKKYTQNAIKVDANFSQFLILSIFNKDSPLHDGAVIVDNQRVMYASTYFPISLDIDISKNYGTRHRAALTISRETDTISIMVSEENGKVSIAFNNKLYSDVEPDFLLEFLKEKAN